MLRILHQELRRQPPGDDLCTVCLVTLSRVGEGARLGISLAGHQQPLLIASAGETEKLGEPGTLLGVRDPIEITESAATLGPGETLLLYTDGVLEGGQPRGRSGEQRLLELCRKAPGLELSRFLELIEQATVENAGGALNDDVALLAVRPSPRPR
jgi:serine phosphatase RsbU (regulator of sigma subunit)